MQNWISVRQAQLQQAFASLKGVEQLRVVQPFFRIDPQITGLEVMWASDNVFRDDPNFECDIYFTQGYDPDFAKLKYVQETGRAKVVATWFWDNHHLFTTTMRAAMLSDVVFCAHNFAAGYLQNNELFKYGGYAALCPVFWTESEVRQPYAEVERSDRLYGGYNSYPEFQERDVLLDQIMAEIPDHNIFLTRHGTPMEQHPFYSMTSLDMLAEWRKYKVALCVSFGQNTTIRMFDALLAGVIPLVVGHPADLDIIIGPDFRASLPVVCVPSLNPKDVAAGYREALALFDANGEEGIRRRVEYTLNNQMPKNRLLAMTDAIRTLANG